MTTDPLRDALDNLPQWAMVGPPNNRHMEAVRRGQYWAIVDVRAALAALDRSGPAEGLREVVADVAAELRWRKAATTDADLAKVLEVALAATPTASPTTGGLDVEPRSHFDGGKGVCVKDGEPMPCAALQSEATAGGERE